MSDPTIPVTNVKSNLTLKVFQDSSNNNVDPTLTFSYQGTSSEEVGATLKTSVSSSVKQLTVGTADNFIIAGTEDVVDPGATAQTTHRLVFGSGSAPAAKVELASTDVVTGEVGSEVHERVLDVSATTRLAAGKELIFNETNPQSLKGLLTAKVSTDPNGPETETPPQGVQFNHDAGFIIPNPKYNSGDPETGPETFNVRISDLYDAESNVKEIANTLSAVCRRVYALEHFTNTQATFGEAPVLGGEVQDLSTAADGSKKGGDKHWIEYFAGLNLDSPNPPGVSDA